jgi:dihydroorotate dehydrogenase
MNFFYKKLLRPFLFRLEAESAHDWACRCLSMTERSTLSRKLIKLICSQNSSDVNLFGLSFPNHIGLAAGMDKNGAFPKTFASLGFGHVEIGTITPRPQTGNKKPRLFRYPKYSALVNRMGFNNDGVETIIKRIERIYPKGKRPVPLGINIGKGKDTHIEAAQEDYIYSLNKCFKQADYITINISSPNTPNLRDLHKTELIRPFLEKLIAANHACSKNLNEAPVPLLLKISPDESYKSLENIVCNARDLGFSGVIATNTSVSRFKDKNFESLEPGGLSGNPIESKSVQIIKFLAKLTEYKFPIIGVGGISSTESAIRKLDAGASLLQIYSSLVYQGPFFPSRLATSLEHRTKNWT